MDIDNIYLVAALIVGVLGGYVQDRVNRDFTSENTNEKSISRDTNAILRR